MSVDRFIDRLETAAAKRLLACGVLLQAEAKRDYSKANPSPHNNPAPVGDWPRARSFNLRDAVEISPRTVAEVKAKGRVRVGITTNAFYGAALRRKGWKGVADTFARIRTQLTNLAGGTNAAGHP